MDLNKYRKAFTPIILGLALWGLSFLSITPKMSVEDALTILVTSGLVWLVPNRK